MSTPLPPHPSTEQCCLCGHTREFHKEGPDGRLYCDVVPRNPSLTFTPRPHPLER
jgi:hypothetical protein